MDLSSVFDKKWGILIKKESESLLFTGLKIPRDYDYQREETFMKQKTHRLLGLLLCLVMILGLMPITAYAEDKIPITEFSGSISLPAPVYGETISDNRPTVSTSAHVNFGT